MSKKILAALLAVMMVLTVVPMTALADEGDAADVLAAPLHDTRTDDPIGDTELNNGYSVSGTVGVENTVNVTVIHTGLRAHGNGTPEAVMGYWVGVAIPQVEGATFNWGFGTTESGWTNTRRTSEITEGENKYDTFYFNATAKEGRDKAGIQVKKGENVVVTYNIDLSGVQRKVEFDETYTKFYWLKSEQPKPQCNISDWRDWTTLLYFKDEVPANQNLFATLVSPSGKYYAIGLNSGHKDQPFSLLTKSQFEIWPLENDAPVAPGIELGDYRVEIYEAPEAFTSENARSIIMENKAKRVSNTYTIRVADDMKITSAGFGLDKETAMAATGLATNNCQDETMWAKFSKATKGQYWIDIVRPGEGTGSDVVAGTNGTDAEASTQWAWSYLNREQTQGTGAVAGNYKVRIYAYAGTTSGPTDVPANMILLDEKTVTASDAITKVEVYKDDVLLSSINGTVSGDTITLSGSAANVGNGPYTVKVVAYTTNGKKAQVVNLTKVEKKLTATDVKLTILKKDYTITSTIDVVDTAIVPAETAGTASESITDPTKKTAAETAAKTVAAAEENLTDLAATGAKTEDAQAEANATAGEAALKEANLKTDDDGKTVTIVVQPFLKVEATEHTDEKITFEIKGKYRVVATTANVADSPNSIKVQGDTGVTSGANAVVVPGKEEVNMPVTSSIDLEVTLPDTFDATDAAMVLHGKQPNHYHKGSIGSDHKLTFTSDDGLSPFTVDKAAQAVANIGGKYYTSLQAAINAVAADETITLTGDASGETITGVNKSFKIVVSGGTMPTANFQGAANYTVSITDGENGEKVVTATYTGGGTTGGNGGGTTVDPNATPAPITPTTSSDYTLTTDKTTAKAGETVTVTVKKADKYPSYYVVSGVTAKSDTGATATGRKNADGTFTFTMPAGKTVTVSATVSHIFDLFKDVPAGSFYAEPVKWAVEKGIALGTDPVNYSSFGTTSSCTRKEMVLFLYRAAGSPKVTGSNTFTDIQGSAYDAYKDAIQWAVDNGITQGTSATTFAPNANCSRSEMVTFLHRYDQKPAVTGTNKFVDVPSDAFYKDAVQWAVNKNITAGTNTEGTTFTPERACTRGEMAIFLHRFLGK